MFGRKKKEQVHKDDYMLAEGIYLKSPEMQIGNIVYSCFLRSLIAFFLVLGSVGGFLSALDLSYNYVIVIVAYMLLSLYFSFLYALSKFLYRDIGYILFFGVFVVAIYLFRIHANSGLYVVVNRVLSRARTFFDLPGVREYEVQIDNDYLTVAITAIFVGMVLIIILNIWLYSRMSLIWAIALTFPLLVIPLYMKLTPDVFYMLLLAIGYLMVIVFKANGHYLAFAWDKPFRFKKKRVIYSQDAGVFQNVLLTAIVFLSCVVFAVQIFVSPATFDGRFKNDTLREKTADVLGNFVLLGFSGFYNQYASVGGMSGGKLGGISNVRPDYLTDLVVSYTPYSNQPVYLKGYTGAIYSQNEWLSEYRYNSSVEEDQEDFEDESMKIEATELKRNSGKYHAVGMMKVKNVGADSSYLYYPYYTELPDYTIYNNHEMFQNSQGLRRMETGEYTYYPQIVWDNRIGDQTPGSVDVSAVSADYLAVPEENQTVIKEECDKIGLKDSMTVNEITDTVSQYFQDNIPYTLSPGATPRGEDFINYFLTQNRKGYCAHFASAATLIFREMGIPARYVEGYAFSFENVLTSDINEQEDPKDYYSGYSAIGDSPVMDVEVTDAMAHAWVEIYVDGFGWKVVEVTPGSAAETDEDNFWDAFTKAVKNVGTDGDNTSGILGDLELAKMAWLIYVVFAIMAVYIVWNIVQILIRKVRRYRICHQEDLREAVVARYADLCDMIRVCDVTFDACKSHKEQMVYMKERYGMPDEAQAFADRVEAISFSKQIIEENELMQVGQMIHIIQKLVWEKAKMGDKIKLCKR